MVCTNCMTYNHAPYIVDAMNGFAMQETTFPVYYLITDDASTDGEPKVIRQYLSEHFQEPYRTEETDDYYLICAIHKTNPSCIFIVFLLKYNHYSIKKSKLPYQSEWRENAKYIAMCEGDDYWIHPQKLQMQVDVLEAYPNYVLAHSRFNRLYQNSGITIPDNFAHENIIATLKENRDPVIGMLNDYDYLVQTCTALIRKKTFDEVCKSDLVRYRGKFLMGDTQLWCFLSRKGKFKYFEDVFSVYRINDGSSCRKKTPKEALRFILSIQEMRVSVANDLNIPDNYLRKIQSDYKKILIKYLTLDHHYKIFVPPHFDYTIEKMLFKLSITFPFIVLIGWALQLRDKLRRV